MQLLLCKKFKLTDPGRTETDPNSFPLPTLLRALKKQNACIPILKYGPIWRSLDPKSSFTNLAVFGS